MAVEIKVDGGYYPIKTETTITNTPENLNLSSFRSTTSDHGGPSKSNRFVVQFSMPDGMMSTLGTSSGLIKDLSFLCEATELPGRGFMSVDARYYGPNFKTPYQTTYEDLNLTFICRDEFEERKFFDNWMQYINPVDSYNFQFRDNYAGSIRILQLSEISGEPARYAYTFEKAYPILINPQPVTWADDNFHRLTVSFTYTRWYRENIDKYTNTSNFTQIRLGGTA